jgi:Ca-activated chloride channel family protein
MVQFANPAYLWLLALVPPLVWWWMRQRRSALRHPTANLLPLVGRRGRLARWGGAVLRGSALAVAVVALAGPRLPDLHTRIDTEGIALVLAVDVSGSMAERDFDWNGRPLSRLEAAQRVFGLFLTGGTETPDGRPAGADFQGRPTDLAGLVTFATRPETVCPLTLSHSVLVHMMGMEKPRSVPGESETNLSDAIAEGLERLQQATPRRKVLVLLTDGEHNVAEPRSGWTPRQAAQVAAGLGIPIYTIDAGGGTAAVRAPETPPAGIDASASPAVVREQAVRTLQELARTTGGQYFLAHDTAALVRACRAIDALERSDIRSFQYRRYHEGYLYLALAAFALFAGALALDRTLWRRLP